MKANELNEKIKTKLSEYDSLESITTSENWDSELMLRLQLVQQTKTKKTSSNFLFLISLIVINGSIMLFSLIKTNPKQPIHSANLQVISNELLITSN